MEYPVIVLAAFGVSLLTLYSGFGLGTLLMPVFALFLPLEVAVAATALVHASNNIVKVMVLGGGADRELVIRFGLPALFASFLGAWVLTGMTGHAPLATYRIGTTVAEITPIKLTMGLLILAFAVGELHPVLRGLRMDRKWLVPGGILSGFFGGFSGHQGALRSAFLVRTGGTPESFVATNAVIGMMVDGARLLVYGWTFMMARHAGRLGTDDWLLVIAGIIGATGGVAVGKRYLHKVTMEGIRVAAGILLLGIGILLASGIL